MIENTLMDNKKIREYLDSIILIEQLSEAKKYKIHLPALSRNIIYVDRYDEQLYFLRIHFLEREYILSKFKDGEGYVAILKTKNEDELLKCLKKEFFN